MSVDGESLLRVVVVLRVLCVFVCREEKGDQVRGPWVFLYMRETETVNASTLIVFSV